MLFEFIKKAEKLDPKVDMIPKKTFITFFKREFEGCDAKRRTFKVIAQKDSRYMQSDDFK
jgi:hypothetical protein